MASFFSAPAQADGVTLQSSGSTLSIKNGGVGTTQLADAAVTLAKQATARQGNTVLSGSSATAGQNQALTRHYHPDMKVTTGQAGSESDGLVWVAPRAGKLRNLRAASNVAVPAGNSVAFTVRSGATGAMADTSLTATLPASNPADTQVVDSANTPSVAAGDLVEMKVVTSATSGGQNPYWSFEFVAD